MKILIVDDELLVRVALKSMINWQEHGFELVGEASDGIEALELIEKYQPDIVITDISMPNMDGLELIKKCKNDYPDTEFLILSCYNEFDYVRDGLKLGANDYILKLSMQHTDLIKALKELQQKIEEKKEKSNDIIKLKTQLNANIHVIKENFFLDVLKNNIFNETEFLHKVEDLDLNISNAYFILVVLEVDDYAYLRHHNDLESDKLMDFAIANIISEVLNSYKIGEVFTTASGEFSIVISFESDFRSRAVYDKIKTIIYESMELLKNVLNISVSAGISNVVKEYRNIKIAYEQAIESVAYKFYKGKMSVILFSELLQEMSEDDTLKSSYYRNTLNAIEAMDFSSIQQNAHAMFKEISLFGNIQPTLVKKLVKELIFTLKKVGEKYDCDVETLMDKEDLFSKIDEIEVLDELEIFIVDLIQKFEKTINESRGKNRRQEVNKICDYVTVNFHEDITVAQMSKMVNMNPDYLSHLFKKEVGISFVDYVTSIRIEKAKEYLSIGNMKIYEVAHKVGYNNVNYFSKLFKKKVGISPGEYSKEKEMR